MQIIRFVLLSLLAVLVLTAGSALVARLHEHQMIRDQANVLDHPEARVALQKSWPVR